MRPRPIISDCGLKPVFVVGRTILRGGTKGEDYYNEYIDRKR